MKPEPKKKPEEEEEEEEPKGKWDDYADLEDGEDESVVASARARHLAHRYKQRDEELAAKAKEGKPRKKGSAFL